MREYFDYLENKIRVYENLYNDLENKFRVYENLCLELEKYIDLFGKSYPNGRQFFCSYNCVDDLKSLLERVL